MRRPVLGTAMLGLLGMLAVVAPPERTAAAAESAAVRIATFNVQSVALDSSAAKTWRERRPAVVKTIMAERPDVIGVQEVNPSRYAYAKRLVDGDTQYLDLRNGLNDAGGTYKLTNVYGYNCENHRTAYKCDHRYRGASGSERILYNTAKLEMQKQGSFKFSSQEPGGDKRYVAWAVFKVKSNGSTFLFTTTHLAKSPQSVLLSQWKQLLAWLKDHNQPGRPIISVGDFNTHNFSRNAAADMIPAMKRAGFGDVLNRRLGTNNVTDPRARSTKYAWVNSANHESYNVANYSFEDQRDRAGVTIDWIFAANSLTVDYYKLALNFNTDTLRVIGTLPSDHNMVRADVRIP